MWCFVFVVFTVFSAGEGILCYYCHQTSNACKDGFSLDSTVCTNEDDVCVHYKYSTIMPDNVNVVAAERGCLSLGNSTCQHKMETRHKPERPEKMVVCSICNTSLCNHINHISSSTILIATFSLILLSSRL